MYSVITDRNNREIENWCYFPCPHHVFCANVQNYSYEGGKMNYKIFTGMFRFKPMIVINDGIFY